MLTTNLKTNQAFLYVNEIAQDEDDTRTILYILSRSQEAHKLNLPPLVRVEINLSIASPDAKIIAKGTCLTMAGAVGAASILVRTFTEFGYAPDEIVQTGVQQ